MNTDRIIILAAAPVVLFGMASASAQEFVSSEVYEMRAIYTDVIVYACFMLCMLYLVYSIQKHAAGGAKAWNILSLAVVLLMVSAFGGFAENFCAGVPGELMYIVEIVCLVAGTVALAAGLRSLAMTVA